MSNDRIVDVYKIDKKKKISSTLQTLYKKHKNIRRQYSH